MRRFAFVAIALGALAMAPHALADVKITDGPYARQDGGTDPVISRCSTDNRQQNEPTVSVSPTTPSLMTAGSNDYCTVPTAGDAWAGFYYSSDGGLSWTDSLLPGYPGDTSADGAASPLQGRVGSAGDPVQAWDNFGHLYYAGISFNRAHPQNGDLWVARYSWQAGPKPQYDFTNLVRQGTPALSGIFNDKIQLEVDRGADSPHSGNVYVCWARFQGSGNNGIFLIRSTDGGHTFGKPTKLSESVHDSQFCDIAVTRTGDVYVLWRGFGGRGQDEDAVLFAKSTDGGATFSKAGTVAAITPWDPRDEYGEPEAAEEASKAACDAGETALCEGAEGGQGNAPGDARDCGDGPFQCLSGYVFFRADTQVRATADPRAGADASTVYAVFDASVPDSETPTGSSYGTVETGIGTQAAVFLVKTTDGGASWSTPSRIDPQTKGHQFFPDISADSGRLAVLWQDSRTDTASGPPSTPSGGDFRTVPISNVWTSANPPGATAAPPGLQTFVATSTDGGSSWSIELASAVPQMPQYEQFGDRDIPFFGDYNYVAVSGMSTFGAWTDQRDTVPGDDPRYTNGDGTDGFDVHQCRTQNPDESWSADTCPDDGGLDQNIFGFVF